MAIWVSITKKGTKKQNFFLLKQLTMHKQDTNSFLKQLKIYNKFLSDFQQMADQSSALFVYLINSHNEKSCADAFPCLCLPKSLAQAMKRHLADGAAEGKAGLFLL